MLLKGYSRKLRIALYSHDTMGLGHVRRNLLIAQVLSASHLGPNILIVAGAWVPCSFAMPPGVDCLILPALYKETNGKYRSRRLRISFPDFIALRGKMLYGAITAFEPDVLIVDNAPRGASHELDTTLDYLRLNRHTRCVLGLRDVLDETSVVHSEWSQHENNEAIRKYYAQVWVYGDPHIYDTVKEYGYSSDIVARVRYTGYLGQRVRLKCAERQRVCLPCSELGMPRIPFVLCMVGGGQDGYSLAEAFAQADLPPGMTGVLLTGPDMVPKARERLLRMAAKKPHHLLRVFEFVPEPLALLQHADCVISMGGYSSVSEILSFGKRALIVPRVVPRQEQLIRAERLRDIGVLDMIHPDNLSPQVLTNWISRNVDQPPKEFRGQIDMNGLERIPRFLEDLLNDSTFDE